LLSNSDHLLPKKLAELRKRREHVVIPFSVCFCRQSQVGSELWIRRPNVFVAVFARQPSIESTTDAASLFKRRFADKSSAQIRNLGNFKLVHRIVLSQRRKEFLVADQFAQRFKHERAFASHDGRVLKRVAIVTRRPAGFHILAAERAIELVDAAKLLLQ